MTTTQPAKKTSTADVIGGMVGHAIVLSVIGLLIWSALTTDVPILRTACWWAAGLKALAFVFNTSRTMLKAEKS